MGNSWNCSNFLIYLNKQIEKRLHSEHECGWNVSGISLQLMVFRWEMFESGPFFLYLSVNLCVKLYIKKRLLEKSDYNNFKNFKQQIFICLNLKKLHSEHDCAQYVCNLSTSLPGVFDGFDFHYSR